MTLSPDTYHHLFAVIFINRSDGETTVPDVIAPLSPVHSLLGSSGSFSSMDLRMIHELTNIPVAFHDILPVMT